MKNKNKDRHKRRIRKIGHQMSNDDKKSGREGYLERVVLTLRAEEIKKAERIIQLENELRELFDKDLKQHERLEQIRDIVIDDLKIARDSVSHYSRSQAFNDAIEETKRTFEKIKNENL